MDGNYEQLNDSMDTARRLFLFLPQFTHIERGSRRETTQAYCGFFLVHSSRGKHG